MTRYNKGKAMCHRAATPSSVMLLKLLLGLPHVLYASCLAQLHLAEIWARCSLVALQHAAAR